MSYILDALKKAEAEREGVSQIAPAGGDHRPPGAALAAAASAPAGTQPMVWAVVGLSIALAGVALGWMLLGRTTPVAQQVPDAGAGPVVSMASIEEPGPVASERPDPALPPAAPSNSPPAAVEPTEPVRMRPPSREDLQDETPLPVMQFSTVRPRVSSTAAPSSDVAHHGALAARPVERGRASTTASASARTSAPSPASDQTESSARIHALHELPTDIRQQLPQLSVGGAMYSDSPASRMLILNGHPFKEGDQPTTHLKLEQINLKSAVLSFKGYRYTINY